MFIIVCAWDPIIAGFMEKFLRFKTQKLRRKFAFFRRCHRWVSGASVVYLLFLSAGVFIISFGLLQESSSLFFVGFSVVVKEIYTSVACDIGHMFWTYYLCFLQLADRCFFLLGYSYGIFTHWFSSSEMFKFTVSFTTKVEKSRSIFACMAVVIEVLNPQNTGREQPDTFLLQQITYVTWNLRCYHGKLVSLLI